MITNALIYERDRAHNAIEQLGESIKARMDVIARRMNLDEMRIGTYGNYYKRDGKDIESIQLDELDEFYLDNVDPYGFFALWTKEKGWN
jgi:hypothetical protein